MGTKDCYNKSNAFHFWFCPSARVISQTFWPNKETVCPHAQIQQKYFVQTARFVVDLCTTIFCCAKACGGSWKTSQTLRPSARPVMRQRVCAKYTRFARMWKSGTSPRSACRRL